MRKKLIKKSKVKFVLGLILGLTLTGGGVYAATTYASKEVYYNNDTSKLSSTNVQDALDELYDKINDRLTTYAFGMPTNSSPVDFQEVISSSGSNAFVRKQGSQLSVCLYHANKLFCMKHGKENWEENKAMLNTTTFPGATCEATDRHVFCEDDSFACTANSDGVVGCYDSSSALLCLVHADGEVDCS